MWKIWDQATLAPLNMPARPLQSLTPEDCDSVLLHFHRAEIPPGKTREPVNYKGLTLYQILSAIGCLKATIPMVRCNYLRVK